MVLIKSFGLKKHSWNTQLWLQPKTYMLQHSDLWECSSSVCSQRNYTILICLTPRCTENIEIHMSCNLRCLQSVLWHCCYLYCVFCRLVPKDNHKAQFVYSVCFASLIHLLNLDVLCRQSSWISKFKTWLVAVMWSFPYVWKA